MHRAHSHRLSAALLNRVIRIWLPAVDSNVQLASRPLPTLQVAAAAAAATSQSGNHGTAHLDIVQATTVQNPCQAKLLPIIAEFFTGFQGQQEMSILAVDIHLQIQVRHSLCTDMSHGYVLSTIIFQVS